MRNSPTRLLLVLLLVVFGAVGCAQPPFAAVDEVAAVGDRVGVQDVMDLGLEVNPETVAELNARGTIAVIDVREDWEYQEGHIPGATLIPLGSLPDRVDEIPQDKPVVLVCRSGNRSSQAYRFLTQQGFDNVHNMVGGMIAWEDARLEMNW